MAVAKTLTAAHRIPARRYEMIGGKTLKTLSERWRSSCEKFNPSIDHRRPWLV